MVYTVDDVEGFKSFTLNHIAEDIKGNIWFASDGDGIFKFDNTNFTNFSTKNGLVSNYCYSVFVDSNYAVWVTHKNAVSRKQLSKTKFEQYKSPLDFSNREFSTHAFYVADRTTISWGTSDGLLVYNGAYDKPSNFVPYCSINKIFFNDSAFYPTQTVNMPYAKYNVKFDFVGISYKNPESVIYKYKIEELDEDWTQLTYSTRSINYPSLSDGKYTFKLICANENGVWLNKPVSFTFYIQSPVWKKWWFYVIILILISALVYIYVKIKTQRYVQNQIKLHAIIDEQTFLLKKEKNALEILSKELTVKNNDMLSSIRYAKRIQDAILPLEDEFKTEYLDVFIYYKPRDIVSGDFYYLRKQKDELIVGAIDCTGHGVPGALMSVVGYKILHKIVEEYKLSSPLEILNSLNTNVSNFFYRNAIKSNTFDINDGMDVALCKINLKKLQIQFSGAGRPLYLVRRGELREHSGSVFSIGKEKDFMPDAPYTQTEFDLLPNDMVYLFSDGFVDQFGGENNKRYTSKALKKLFERIASNDVKTQKELIETEYQSWSAGRNQIDDILIIGLKIK
jgi:serine phosphatase RsbU (regulator of sigma subunit)